MAIVTGAPNPGMGTGTYWEKGIVFDEICRIPAYREMAFLAASSKSHFGVRWARSCLEFGVMARDTFRFQKRILALDFAEMASLAIEPGMGPHQRKGGIGMDRRCIEDAPALRVMTTITIGPQLTLMRIRVA